MPVVGDQIFTQASGFVRTDHEIEELRLELDRLKNWHVGYGTRFSELGEKMSATADLNLKIAELLLRRA